MITHELQWREPRNLARQRRHFRISVRRFSRRLARAIFNGHCRDGIESVARCNKRLLGCIRRLKLGLGESLIHERDLRSLRQT
jgi:hypothetical protein